MAQRIAVIAREAFVFNGHRYAAGEAFEVSPIEAAALTYQRRAMFAAKGTRKEPADKGRQYRRRDMVAEP